MVRTTSGQVLQMDNQRCSDGNLLLHPPIKDTMAFYQLPLMRLRYSLVSQINSIVDLPVETADVMMLDGVEVGEVVDEVVLQHEWSW